MTTPPLPDLDQDSCITFWHNNKKGEKKALLVIEETGNIWRRNLETDELEIVIDNQELALALQYVIVKMTGMEKEKVLENICQKYWKKYLPLPKEQKSHIQKLIDQKHAELDAQQHPST